MIILEAENLFKGYNKGVQALNGVSLKIEKGEAVGIAGESGSGKSTLAKCLLGLEIPDKGSIRLGNHTFHPKDKKSIQRSRSSIQTVMQNPTASLNPKLRIIDSLMEPLDIREKWTLLPGRERRKTRERKALELLSLAGIPDSHLYKYPHELSGGQKQRVNIVRALSTEPALLILDEPTSSLDASTQARMLNDLKDLQEQFGTSYLFISHDLAAVHFMCSRTMIMKDGEVVDAYERQDTFAENRHPYTKSLLEVFEK
ncbi:ATP-binding cassette domain-containing protein [Bacillus mangrovi]|uniref:ATP-binding cassette domain-containing protein n=2 Tax=Metabacillus mangrovi TaxID=1491830 RepID=A0A7X2V5Q1_9BACI|nr:ATP-binding cassette domain-containing protein [Metabacillus mangrovi]